MQRMTFRHPGNRAGFTLLELLVVIAIIAILASLGFVMVKNFGQTSRDAQTQATIRKVDAALQDRLQAMSRFFEISDRRTGRNPDILDSVSHPAYVDLPADRQNWDQAKGDGDASRMKQIELLARKKFERKHFPMTFAEANANNDDKSDITGNPITPYPTPFPFNDSSSPRNYLTTIPGPPGRTGPDPDPETESAEVLYYFLSHAATFGTEAVGSVDFTDREIADTDSDGLQEIVDGWGRPIRFYRWPTRLIRPQQAGDESNPATPATPIRTDVAARFLIGNIPSLQVLQNDPQDQLQEINRIPYNDPNIFEKDFHTKQTWHSPLVVSAGPDGVFGLLSPTTAMPSYGDLAQPDNGATQESRQDNISNLLLRVGGK